jgi:3'(2'), 5'-bisphosphate nucleotidase
MKTELQNAEDLAVRAGAILLKHYGQKTSVAWKGKNDPVTAADLEASRFIVDELRALFPADGILCEEEQDDLLRLSSPRVWVIDPMDGTKEFIARRGEFVVMIGLAIDGEARLGVVYQPTEDKLYSGAMGYGAFLSHNGLRTQLRVSAEGDPTRATIALSRSHLSGNTEAIRKHLGIHRSIQTGSIGIKVGLVCEAVADVYVQGRGTSLWDTCGPEAIIHAAGGRMTDAAGQPFRYNVEDVRNLRGVVATNGVLHDRVVEAAVSITRRADGR